MNQLTTVKNFETLKSELNKELLSTAQSVCRIGYLLKLARDTDILNESSYSDVYDFATAEFGLDKSQVSRFMRINDRFSIEGNSEQLLPEYSEYGSSKLSLMLTLPDEINEELSPEYSKSDIQAIKEEYEEEQKITDLEVMMEEKPEDEPDEFIALVTKHLNDEHPEPIELIHWGIEQGIEIDKEDIKDTYMPSGGAQTYNIRIEGQGRFMVNCKDTEITIVNMRDPANKSSVSWEEFSIATLADEKTRNFAPKEPEKPEKTKEKPKKVEKSKPKKEEKKAAKKEEIMPKPEEPKEAAGETEHEQTAAGEPTGLRKQVLDKLDLIKEEVRDNANWETVRTHIRELGTFITMSAF